MQKLKIPILKQVISATLPGLCVTVFTLPIQLYFYHEIPTYSILLNMLILPFVELIMIIGLVVMILPGFGFAAGAVRLILMGYEWLCETFLLLPENAWNPGAPKPWQIVTYYVLLVMGVIISHYLKKNKIRVISSAILLTVAILIIGVNSSPPFMVTFLDVGQGDCIVVQTGQEAYLFDCGSTTIKDVGENVLVPFLKHQGISKLDGIFVSHPDADHMNGVQQLLEMEDSGIQIEKLILPDISKECRTEEFDALLKAAQKYENAAQKYGNTKDIAIMYMSAGDAWQSGQVVFNCLHPQKDSYWTETNSYSLCFLVSYGEFSMLLTGDVEGTGEMDLLKQLQEEVPGEKGMHITMLKAAHHGSAYSTSEEFLKYVQPALVVISCGKENSYGHPHKELLERLEKESCRIYKTMDRGAITVEVKHSKIRIYSYLQADS